MLCNCNAYDARQFIDDWMRSGTSASLTVHAWQTASREVLVLPSALSLASIAQTLVPYGLDALSAALKKDVSGSLPLPAELPASIMLQEENSPQLMEKLLNGLVLFQSYLRLRSVEAFRALVLALYSMWRVRALRLHQEQLSGVKAERVVLISGPVLPAVSDVLQSLLTRTNTSLNEGRELSWPFGMCEGLSFTGTAAQSDLICGLFEDLPQLWPAVARALVRPQNASAMYLSSLVKQALGPSLESSSVDALSDASAVVSTPSQFASIVFAPGLSDTVPNIHFLKRAAAENLSNVIAERSHSTSAAEATTATCGDDLSFSTIVPAVARKLCERYDQEEQWGLLYGTASNWYAFDGQRLEPLFYLMRALRHLGQHKSALHVAQISAPLLNTAQSSILMGMAQEHMRIKNFSMALDYFNALPENFRNKVSSLTNMGICEYQLGRITEAIACFEQALTLKPGHEQALKYIQLAKTKQTHQREMLSGEA